MYLVVANSLALVAPILPFPIALLPCSIHPPLQVSTCTCIRHQLSEHNSSEQHSSRGLSNREHKALFARSCSSLALCFSPQFSRRSSLLPASPRVADVTPPPPPPLLPASPPGGDLASPPPPPSRPGASAGGAGDSGRGRARAVPRSGPDLEQERGGGARELAPEAAATRSRPDPVTAATGTPGFELGDEAGEPGAPDPGLEYLHKSCSPPLIHRDVKTQNILLTANLEAKISDFGLTRAFSSETRTHITTQPAGTLGYLDPEYYATSHLRDKSDVYSFGVVLLALITAQPAIIPINNTERKSIAQWVRERLSEGDIESVTDPRIRGDCDVNSVRKVAELALHCTERAGRDRPTMTEVVDGLRESLQLETSSRSMRCSSIGTSGSAFADAEPVGVLEAEQIGETSAR